MPILRRISQSWEPQDTPATKKCSSEPGNTTNIDRCDIVNANKPEKLTMVIEIALTYRESVASKTGHIIRKNMKTQMKTQMGNMEP